MEVCVSCHEKDKNVTKCKSEATVHPSIRSYTGKTQCYICGKVGEDVYFCYRYREYLMREAN